MKRRSGLSLHRDFMVKGGGIISSTLNKLGKPVGALINKSIDLLPFELHLPGNYQYCGPGTKLKKRLARGDPGINKLDQACKEHDIAYSKFSDSAERSIADKILASKAWQRVKSSDGSIGEKAAALAVTAAMKTKTAFGGGSKRRRGAGRKKISSRKRGAGIKRKTRRTTRRNLKPALWSMIKKGQGLFLRPYRVY